MDLSFSVRDLGPWPGIKPGPPVLGAESLSHWTPKEVSSSPFFTTITSLAQTPYCRDCWVKDQENLCRITNFLSLPLPRSKLPSLSTTHRSADGLTRLANELLVAPAKLGSYLSDAESDSDADSASTGRSREHVMGSKESPVAFTIRSSKWTWTSNRTWFKNPIKWLCSLVFWCIGLCNGAGSGDWEAEKCKIQWKIENPVFSLYPLSDSPILVALGLRVSRPILFFLDFLKKNTF